MKKNIAFVMILLLLFNVCSISVLGLDDDQIAETVEQTNSDDTQELAQYDATLYEEIKSEIQSIASTSTYSFSSSAGGTLYLNYTGSYNSLGGVIINRIVYLDRPLTLFLEEVYNSQKADTIADVLLSEISGVVTSALATKIAKLLGTKSSVVTVIIGATISALVFVIRNLERWDFNDALNNSSTGKLKLSYCNYWDVIENIYLNFTNYEPWDDGMITVPANYDYSWSAEIYDTRETANFCKHQFQNWTTEDSALHVKSCKNCSFEIFEEHVLTVTSAPVDESYHTMKCVDCNYTISHSHVMRWVSMNSDLHKGTCTICNYVKTESHAASYDNLKGQCKKCGYIGSISSIMSFLLTQRK